MATVKPNERLRANTEVDPQRLGHPSLAAVKAYWDEKRGARPMPSRADIDPVDLREHLGWIMLLDVIGDYDDFRFRLIGTKVTRYFFVEATGKTVREAFAPFGVGIVAGVLAVYRKAARDCVPVRAFGDAGWLGRDYYDFDALYLPLSDDGATANKVLSVFTFDYRRVAARSDSTLG
ncbi:PAS domain-containing protein [Parvibaculum sp.]|uniref:PAS domain-containing protein n=1 Tax=Parvibaculum sp. TaxID=2024848 RepID=UPI002D09BEFF|nr:PAS domain-containing protein [Parvibaculum sp.]HUD50209.1 PAS domain-containing protein [Parvibaculum sp.]